MMRKFIMFISLFALFSCTPEKEVTPNSSNNNNPDVPLVSSNGHLKYEGTVSMNEGPHQLVIQGNQMYACRDNKIYQFSLNNPSTPALQKSYTQEYAMVWGGMYFKNNILYACSPENQTIYCLDANLTLLTQYYINNSFRFKPTSLFIDSDSTFYIGGSDGSNGTLLKCILQSDTLQVQSSWRANYNQSVMASINAKGDHILASLATGDMLSFAKANIANGPVKTATFTNEVGHEKWGKSFIILSDYAYWANWGAGFISVDVSDAANPRVTKILSNTKFKDQYPDLAEGTNVYDVAYNSTHNLLCVANGWSGVLLISPNNPDVVQDFIDPLYFQNYSIATYGDYIYVGNISGGRQGDMKGLAVFKIQ